jgi:hypothetical protein
LLKKISDPSKQHLQFVLQEPHWEEQSIANSRTANPNEKVKYCQYLPPRLDHFARRKGAARIFLFNRLAAIASGKPTPRSERAWDGGEWRGPGFGGIDIL